MKNIFLILTATLILTANVCAKVTVAASLPDLASIAAFIGGDQIESFSIARATDDPHSIEVLPSYMVRVSRADIYLKVGLSLDQWADLIVEGSRNSKVKLVDCSQGVTVLEKPATKVDASMGDVHPEGNPHYWLDPSNGLVVAQTIANALITADPANSETYNSNLAKFQTDLKTKLEQWNLQLSSVTNKSFITYHSSWTYFANTFGFEIPAKIEPIPGIPPTASHLVELVKIIHERKIPFVIREVQYSEDGPNYLTRETGIKQIKLQASCQDSKADSYLNHFDEIINAIKSVN